MCMIHAEVDEIELTGDEVLTSLSKKLLDLLIYVKCSIRYSKISSLPGADAKAVSKRVFGSPTTARSDRSNQALRSSTVDVLTTE